MSSTPTTSLEPSRSLLELRDVFKIYREGEIETVALRGVSLKLEAGAFVAILGRSGSGKSTLLNVASGLTIPSAGSVWFDGVPLHQNSETTCAQIRHSRMGLVFQSGNLLPFLSIEDQLVLAMQMENRAEQRDKARLLLHQVGLDHRRYHRPTQLSGGEQQRAAMALALVNDPQVLLADELTGELDTYTAEQIIEVLEDVHQRYKMALVLVTHNTQLAERATQRFNLADGALMTPTNEPESDIIATGWTPVIKGSPLIQARGLQRRYPNGVQGLPPIDLAIWPGESVAIMGPSGCGKTTLLNLLGGLDRPTAGTITIAGTTLNPDDHRALVELRRQEIGSIFQAHNLLPALSARENVALPLILTGVTATERQTRAQIWLERVGLADMADKTPDQLSAGQRQRVAIARSLIHEPTIILADEPTGNLDSTTAVTIADLMISLTHEQKIALVVVTHDVTIAKRCSRMIILSGEVRPAQDAERPRLGGSR